MAADRGGRDEAGDDARADQLRVDRWLWCARFYKSRGQAAEAVAGGHVHVNGARAKPARRLAVGDYVEVSQHGRAIALHVRAIPARRGPATEARACYEETPASRERAERLHEQRRLAALGAPPRPDRRPDKKERRDLAALERRQRED